ncbi:MAG: Gfo/Idh/MocA family oxidoreductase [Planctomycetaceae bacterium]
MTSSSARAQVRAGMVGMGMIFDETYRPFFENMKLRGLYDRSFGDVDVPLVAVASKTGQRADRYQQQAKSLGIGFQNFRGDSAVQELLKQDLTFACVATPDNRHFDASKAILQAGVHLLVEKPSVLSLQELDELVALAEERGVLARVVYHKLLDPDHKKLRTLVHDNVLHHVNNGYCSLLEPRQISGAQFSEWITGRNPGTYVAVHYIKLIDFTFGGRLKTITCTGQRGIVGAADGNTWDSVQLRLIYEYDSGREAAFDIHTSWVTPDNFPGYVEQEVQFRFDNGIWNGHSRKRGVEVTVENLTPIRMKNTINNHYNGSFVEPWGERTQRGYGVEVIDRFAREVAFVEHGGSAAERDARLQSVRSMHYADLAADRPVVAAVQAMEMILEQQATGCPDCVVRYDGLQLQLLKPMYTSRGEE